MMTKEQVFGKPAVGSTVTVTTAWHDYMKGFYWGLSREHTYTGVVVKSERNDDVDSFRLATGRRGLAVSIIDLGSVSSLVYGDGRPGTRVCAPAVTIAAWEIKSSKPGKSYTVTRNGSNYECNCAGYGFRRSCRHINEVKVKA